MEVRVRADVDQDFFLVRFLSVDVIVSTFRQMKHHLLLPDELQLQTSLDKTDKEFGTCVWGVEQLTE
jgi:hypothetical protein